MTPDKATALREAAERATPGPWVVWSSLYEGMDTQLRSADTTVEGKPLAEFYRRENGFSNAAYIALANPDTMKDLLAERERLRGALERIALFSEVRSKDSTKVAAKVASGAFETITETARQALEATDDQT